MKAKRDFRLAVSGAVCGALYLGIAVAAMASDEPEWVRQFGTDGTDIANGVATDGAGNVYLTGLTGGSLAGANRGTYDAWVAKYDPNGRPLWRRQFGTEEGDVAYGPATDAAGNVYLTGYTEGSLGGANLGEADGWLAKYDPAGRARWRRQFGTEEKDVAFGSATDAAGNVYLTGYTEGSLGGANRGGADAWVAKYDPNGHVLWRRQLGTEGNDVAAGVATDAAGNVYLAGYTEGSLRGANRGEVDAWVAKYDPAGRALWRRQFGTEESDVSYGPSTDAAGNVYLTGYTEGSLGGVHRGLMDAWVAKYDPSGHVLWRRQLGTERIDHAWGAATDAAGNVYLTGYTEGSLGGGTQRGLDDAWVAKYDPAGHLLWKRQLGTDGWDSANGVATDAAGNVYLTGYTDGLLGSVNSGGFDAWVAKYSAERAQTKQESCC